MTSRRFILPAALAVVIATASTVPSNLAAQGRGQVISSERRRGDEPRLPADARVPDFFAAINATGDYRIDALLSGYKWGTTTVTYSFYSNAVWGGQYYGSETVSEVSEPVKTNVRAIMALYGSVMNVNFVEVTETSSTIGYIRVMDSTAPSYAYAYYPASSAMFSTSGDVHLNIGYDRLGDTNGFQHPAGQHGYVSLIHELGHAVGLKHPFSDTPNLPAAEDNFATTVMTYTFLGNSPGTMMGYDLMALQYLYGARSSRAGNDTYVGTRATIDQYRLGTTLYITPSNTTKQAIWDSGGYNVLDLSELTGSTSGYRIDLKPLGWISTGSAFQNNYFVAGLALGPNVSIRRLVNSVSSDQIYANAEANVFAGYASNRATGNDVLYNADGADTVDLSGYQPNEVVESPSGTDLILNFGANGRLTIAGYFQAPTPPAIVYGGISPGVSVNDISVTEGNSGTTAAVFTLDLTSPVTSPVTVNWATADGTAAGGSDFTAASGTVAFAAGESQKTVTVNVVGDTTVEGNEQFTVTLSGASSGLTIADGQGIGTITNDDLPPNQLPVAAASATPTTGTAPLAVAFSSAGSFDPDGSIVAYAWTFGDGGTSNQANPSHTYAAGTFTATLTVTDNRGGTASKPVTVTVNPAALVPMWVAGLSGQVQSQGANKFARVTVTVRDNAGQPVAGAVVAGAWSGVASGSASATTNASGVVVIDSAKTKKGGSATFTVSGITKSGFTYTPAQNVATSITVTIP